MKYLKLRFLISIIPALIFVWGIFNLCFWDPFFSKSSDPEYPYLINGLNCSMLNFDRIGHTDHPGTPLQVFNGLIIRLTHFISGKEDIAKDVFTRPEVYLNTISFSLLFIQTILVLIIGFIALKRKIPVWKIIILQAGCFYNDVLMWLFSRVNPDRFFIITGLLFIIVYLKHGYKNQSNRLFALWSGVIMALGLATKFNFLPLLILPLFLINNNKNRFIYTISGIISFLIFISPILNQFKNFSRFITGIFNHDGIYGSGESKVFNLQKMIDSFIEIIKLNPEIIILMIALISAFIYALIQKKKNGVKNHYWIFAGFILIIALQIIMVSKHFKNYYLVPIFISYGFIFFIFSEFLSIHIKKKPQLILYSSLLPVIFVLINIIKVEKDIPQIAKDIRHREKTIDFVKNEISEEDFWFIEPTWESGPHLENALIYGLSYCAHKELYYPLLIRLNPNIITYEGNNLVKSWRIKSYNLDSLIITGTNINIYSTPGRQSNLLHSQIDEAAARNNISLIYDTIYSDTELNNKIIRVKAQNDPGELKIINMRQKQIDYYIYSINNTPDWLSKCKEKAKQKNITTDSMILLDAIWMADNE